MTAKTFAEVALKVWGIVTILGALLAMPAALWMVWSAPEGDPQAALLRASQIGYVLNVVVQLVGGIVVLVWADRIAALFEADETPLQIGMSGSKVAVLAFAIVGVFVLVDGVQNLAGAGYVLWTRSVQVDTVSYMWARQGEEMIEAAVQIIAGAFLILGREALLRGWSRLRGERAPDSGDSNGVGEA
jgi:hypothetical protein